MDSLCNGTKKKGEVFEGIFFWKATHNDNIYMLEMGERVDRYKPLNGSVHHEFMSQLISSSESFRGSLKHNSY